ncbi:class A sortase [Periweissella cryptocerci]|uniref:Class A sortase n=1 Tax=Periweissella cryptocerci TaxID=2506420 RepID=A0A4P6YXA8_9LACO|nr:class A sortase [Periweissella cryptocerci]QBO37393.1 class A sortase [Periweissella cryptocerci]
MFFQSSKQTRMGTRGIRIKSRRRRRLIPIIVAVLLVIFAGISTVWSLHPEYFQGRLNQSIVMAEAKRHPFVSEGKGKYLTNVDMPTWGELGKLRKDDSGLRLRAYIAVPKLRIELPIYQGTTKYTLAMGAGTMKGKHDGILNEADVLGASNYALSGHNMADYLTYFSPFQRHIMGTSLEGFNIYVTDGKYVYKYKHTAKYIVNNDGEASEWIKNTKATDINPVITLVTCFEQAPYWTHARKRIIIRGDFLKKYDLNKQNAKKLFNISPDLVK